MMAEEGQFSDADDSPQTTQYIFKSKPLTKKNLLEEFKNKENTNKVDEPEDEDEDEDDFVSEWIDKNDRLDKSNRYSRNQPSQNNYLNKVNLEKYEGSHLPSNAANLLIQSDKKAESKGYRRKDKVDRATVEKALDPRTLAIVGKMINSKIIECINGCISTGKEANVYHGPSYTDEDYALKIYKTSILIFKDRDRYVNGDYRFARGCNKTTNRQKVEEWALKEWKNLSRLHSHGLNVPKPILIKGNVLLMNFIGNEGWPAPLLKDANISFSKYCQLYQEAIIFMWNMYNKCKLVHADFSEYNIMYHNGKLVVIDVSQSVEHEHPSSLEFLRTDCKNITDFFKKKGVATMNMKELFNFITDPTITQDKIEAYLDKMKEKVSERVDDENDIEDQVFKNIYIPKRLDQVIDIERDINKAKSGEDLVYKTITGLKSDLSGLQMNPEILENNSDSEEKSEHDNEEVSKKSNFKNTARPRNESPESKKERKKGVKEAQAIKRETKKKKHVKKREESLKKK